MGHSPSSSTDWTALTFDYIFERNVAFLKAHQRVLTREYESAIAMLLIACISYLTSYWLT